MRYLLNLWSAIQTYEIDVPLQFFGGLICTIAGYYIISKITKPTDRMSRNFAVLYSFGLSETVIIIRKLMQFFIDFFTGSNLMQTETVSDDHWFFKVFGFGMSPLEQRPVMDMGEDFFLGTLGSLLTALGLFVYFGKKNKKVRQKSRKNFSEWLRAIPHKCIAKYYQEKQKLAQQTNLADLLLWWCVRFAMFYAFLTMENRQEAMLLLVNLLGTVAISVLHIFAPSESFFGRINYKIQSLLTIMVFCGSYCGNYIFLYQYVSRYDAVLHFISGIISVMAGYYIASEFVRKETKGSSLLITDFALVFSFMIIPVHEMVEFIGDFIWGTANQGYGWIPNPNGIFYRIFGYGAERIQLNSVFDSMNDALFAGTSSVITAAILLPCLLIGKKIKPAKAHSTDTQKQEVTC